LSKEDFTPGHTYENVYLIVADSSGYSNIVRSNPRDQAAHAFDLLRQRVAARVHDLSAELNCARTEFWSWRGDGGLIVIHDDDESTARNVALQAALGVLLTDLGYVRGELKSTELNGDLRLRIAVHKGTITYSSTGDSGAVHSPDINFVAHLEEVTPPDCMTISEEVYNAAGPHAETFTKVGNYERRDVYMRAMDSDPRTARHAWLVHNGLSCEPRVMAHRQRPSQQEKARLLEVATEDVIDLGTGLRTSANYLITTERPAIYRDAVLDFLDRGGTYRCVLMDPKCPATAVLSQYRGENLPDKIRGSIQKFSEFKNQHGDRAQRLEVYYGHMFPGFSAIAADIHTASPVVLYSPYLMSMAPLDMRIENGDSPHYLVTPSSHDMLDKIVTHIDQATATGQLERRL
jgi:class 3 adenylate cyclase